jgi:hypothetical protein
MRAIVTDAQRWASPKGRGAFGAATALFVSHIVPAMLPPHALSAPQNRPGQIGCYLHRHQ